MSLRSQRSLAILFASGLLGGTAFAVPYAPVNSAPASAANPSQQTTDGDGSTSALRTQALTLPTNDTAPTTTAQNTPAAQTGGNPVPPMGAANPLATTTGEPTAQAPTAPAANLLEGITSPLGTTGATSNTTADTSAGTKPIDLGTEQPLNLPQSLAVVVLSLAGLAVFGLSLVRYRNRQIQNPAKSEKPMQIINTLPLSPKRQLIMVRIRDQEIVLASTEQGISMLTEVGNSPQRAQAYPMLSETRRPRERSNEIVQDARDSMTRLMPAQETEERIIAESKSSKSDMLLKALNGIKEKKSTRKAPAEETVSSEPKDLESARGSKAAFPKYLANAFQQEAKRELGKQRDASTTTEDDSVENVSRMIREKLKTMQPTGN